MATESGRTLIRGALQNSPTSMAIANRVSRKVSGSCERSAKSLPHSKETSSLRDDFSLYVRLLLAADAKDRKHIIKSIIRSFLAPGATSDLSYLKETDAYTCLEEYYRLSD